MWNVCTWFAAVIRALVRSLHKPSDRSSLTIRADRHEQIIADIRKIICTFSSRWHARRMMEHVHSQRRIGLTPVCLVIECNNTGFWSNDHEQVSSSRAHFSLNSTCSTTGNIMPRGAGTHNARPTCWDIARVVFQSLGYVRRQWYVHVCKTYYNIGYRGYVLW